MPVPGFVGAGALVILETGNSNVTKTLVTVGNIVFVQVVQDGVVDLAAVTVTDSSVEDLSGTNNALTLVSTAATGDLIGTVATQVLYVGRAKLTTVTINVSTTGDDCYSVVYEFSGVSAGAAAAVYESKAAGAGNSTIVLDTGVTTLGPDRLACNFVGVNDNNPQGSFTGETGGDWTLASDLGSATGTQAEVALQTASMLLPGTIDGGSFTMATDPWGVIGLALIGERTPRYGATNFQNPGVL